MKTLKKSIITTFLIEQMHCDSSCAYCYLIQGKNINFAYSYSGELAVRLDKILEFAKIHFPSPLVKLCGGEIFLMDNLHEYTKKLLKEYAYVPVDRQNILGQLLFGIFSIISELTFPKISP